MRLYRFLQWLLRWGTHVFFREIQVVGRDQLPAEGEAALILCGNHPNSLLDPILLTAHFGRIVHFAAKDTLFSSPLLAPFLRALGAVPVRRRGDHPEGKLDNEATFAAMHEALGAGRAIGIFPEGLSHDESQLAPLRTGAARIALGARRQHPDQRIYLVPVGLVYFRRHRFRGSVLVQFGTPIPVPDRAPDPGTAAEAEAVRGLTRLIDEELRALTVNAPSWEQVWVLDAVRRLYRPDRAGSAVEGAIANETENLLERVAEERRFNEIYPAIRDQPEVRRLYARVRAFRRRLDALGVDDEVFARDLGPRRIFLAAADHVLLLLVDLPLFVIGAPIHLPLGLLVRWVGRNLAPRRDVVATTKFLVGFLLVLLVYISLSVAAGWFFGVAWGLTTAILLPLSGRAVIHVLARAHALRHLFATAARVLLLRREIVALRAERASLTREVVAAVDRYRETARPA